VFPMRVYVEAPIFRRMSGGLAAQPGHVQAEKVGGHFEGGAIHGTLISRAHTRGQACLSYYQAGAVRRLATADVIVLCADAWAIIRR